MICLCVYHRPSRIRIPSAQRAHVTLSPTTEEVKNGFRSILAGFENTIGNNFLFLFQSHFVFKSLKLIYLFFAGTCYNRSNHKRNK